MCPKQGLESFQKNIYKLKENDKATFFSPVEEWVLPAASTKEPEKREFPVDSGASMHVVSVKDLNFAEFGDHEDIKKSDNGDDGQRRGANKRRSDSILSDNWIFLSK